MPLLLIRSPLSVLFTEILGDNVDPEIIQFIRIREGWQKKDWKFVTTLKRSKRYSIIINLMVSEVLQLVCSEFNYTVVCSTVYYAFPDNKQYILYVLHKSKSFVDAKHYTQTVVNKGDSAVDTKDLRSSQLRDKATETIYDERYYEEVELAARRDRCSSGEESEGSHLLVVKKKVHKKKKPKIPKTKPKKWHSETPATQGQPAEASVKAVISSEDTLKPEVIISEDVKLKTEIEEEQQRKTVKEAKVLKKSKFQLTDQAHDRILLETDGRTLIAELNTRRDYEYKAKVEEPQPDLIQAEGETTKSVDVHDITGQAPLTEDKPKKESTPLDTSQTKEATTTDATESLHSDATKTPTEEETDGTTKAASEIVEDQNKDETKQIKTPGGDIEQTNDDLKSFKIPLIQDIDVTTRDVSTSTEEQYRLTKFKNMNKADAATSTRLDKLDKALKHNKIKKKDQKAEVKLQTCDEFTKDDTLASRDSELLKSQDKAVSINLDDPLHDSSKQTQTDKYESEEVQEDKSCKPTASASTQVNESDIPPTVLEVPQTQDTEEVEATTSTHDNTEETRQACTSKWVELLEQYPSNESGLMRLLPSSSHSGSAGDEMTSVSFSEPPLDEIEEMRRKKMMKKKKLLKRRRKYDLNEVVDRMGRLISDKAYFQGKSSTSETSERDTLATDDPEVVFVTSKEPSKSILEYVIDIPKKLSQTLLQLISGPSSQPEMTPSPNADPQTVHDDQEPSTSRIFTYIPPSSSQLLVPGQCPRKSTSTSAIPEKAKRAKPKKVSGVIELRSFVPEETLYHEEKETESTSSTTSLHVERDISTVALQDSDSAASNRHSSSSFCTANDPTND